MKQTRVNFRPWVKCAVGQNVCLCVSGASQLFFSSLRSFSTELYFTREEKGSNRCEGFNFLSNIRPIYIWVHTLQHRTLCSFSLCCVPSDYLILLSHITNRSCVAHPEAPNLYRRWPKSLLLFVVISQWKPVFPRRKQLLLLLLPGRAFPPPTPL